MGGVIVNVWLLLAGLLSVAAAVAITILIAKGIKYLKRAEAREAEYNCRNAKATIDEIERELNEKRERP